MCELDEVWFGVTVRTWASAEDLFAQQCPEPDFFLQTVSPFPWNVLVPQGHETRIWYSCSWKIWFVSDTCFYSCGLPEILIYSWKCYQASKNCVCMHGLNFQRSCLALVCSHLWFLGAKYAWKAAKPVVALACGGLRGVTQMECRLQIEQVLPNL